MVYSTMTSSVSAPPQKISVCGWGRGPQFLGAGHVWSGVDLKGQELLRVHVVERAQVGQFQEQFGEDGDLVGMILGDQTPKSSNQSLL